MLFMKGFVASGEIHDIPPTDGLTIQCGSIGEVVSRAQGDDVHVVLASYAKVSRDLAAP